MMSRISLHLISHFDNYRRTDTRLVANSSRIENNLAEPLRWKVGSGYGNSQGVTSNVNKNFEDNERELYNGSMHILGKRKNVTLLVIGSFENDLAKLMGHAHSKTVGEAERVLVCVCDGQKARMCFVMGIRPSCAL
ncbi:hypothetical protein VNO78_12410 [Psophocarpus tetragonolobus]|uniref:Uncharacterized protein n=1 Tax=Psophocarpus tetragonolobus TaxID=3891 RepID=A0AAN9XP88_PSOTE